MTSWLFTIIILTQVSTVGSSPNRIYHKVTLDKVATTKWTHIETCGLVTYSRKMQDGDWHITLGSGKVKVVVEIIPLIPLHPPLKGSMVRVRGISRFDRKHMWAEIHPAEQIDIVKICY